MNNSCRCGCFGFLLAAAGVFSCFAGPADLKVVPANSAWMVHVDVDGLRGTSVGKFILTELGKPEADNKLSMLKSFIGFDPRKDLHGVTLFGERFSPQAAVGLVYADFNASQLTGVAENLEQHEVETVEQHEIHSWIDGDRRAKEGGEPRTYAAIHQKILLLSQKQEPLVKALAVLNGKGATMTPEVTAAKSTDSAGAVVEAFARKLDLPGSGPHAVVLRQAKHFSLHLAEAQDKIAGSLQMVTDDAETAKQMATLVKGVVALLALQKDKPEAMTLARSLSVTDKETRAVVNVSLPSEDLLKVLRAKWNQ